MRCDAMRCNVSLVGYGLCCSSTKLVSARSDNCSRHYDEARQRERVGRETAVPEVDTGVRAECVRVWGGVCLDDDGLTLTLCFVARCS